MPLSSKTLFYSATPDALDSWQPVEISAPENSANGFRLATPLRLSPSGKDGDTLYFRYYGESAELSGTMSSTISYYTSLNGAAGITYDRSTVTYETSRGYYQVKVDYRYEDDSEAAPAYTGTYRKDDTYEVISPEIENYKADITKVSGTVQDGDVEYIVYYRLIPEEPPVPDEKPKHTVTVKCIYEDGTPAAESYVEELEEGSSYEVISPIITDYEPDQEKVSGEITENDIEHTVVYTSIKSPEPQTPIVPGPAVPEDPTPEPGSSPLPPIIPGSNIIDGELLYLAPLGEIAFVPNTGIVGDTVAAIFEAGFAEVILSQGFVMAILLIFAGSFATWFSLRKYMSMDLTTRSMTKKHPKMPTTKKTIHAKTITRNVHTARSVKERRKGTIRV